MSCGRSFYITIVFFLCSTIVPFLYLRCFALLSGFLCCCLRRYEGRFFLRIDDLLSHCFHPLSRIDIYQSPMFQLYLNRLDISHSTSTTSTGPCGSITMMTPFAWQSQDMYVWDGRRTLAECRYMPSTSLVCTTDSLQHMTVDSPVYNQSILQSPSKITHHVPADSIRTQDLLYHSQRLHL